MGSSKFDIFFTAVFFLAVLNFTAFFIVALFIGGDAFNGKVENGRYFLANHGTYTEVSEAVYLYSKAHIILVICTIALVFLLGGLKALRGRR